MRCLRPSIMVLLMLLCRNALHQSHRQNDRQTSSPTGYTVHTFKYHRRHRLKRQPCGILAQRDGRGPKECLQRWGIQDGELHCTACHHHKQPQVRKQAHLLNSLTGTAGAKGPSGSSNPVLPAL